jgi:hypothetical protein
VEVSRTPTPLTRAQMAALLVPAYVQRFGELPDRNRAELLLALACLENANGKAIIQFNWGNLSVFPSEAVPYWRPPWFDLVEVEALPPGPKRTRLLDLHQRMLDHKAPSAFLALSSHEAGLQRWLGDLQRRPSVLAAASSGDATTFAHQIFESRYCPDVECRDAGPSYAKVRDEIRAAGLFASLAEKKKSVGRTTPELPGLWFWCWGLLLYRRTSGIGSNAAAAAASLLGEP